MTRRLFVLDTDTCIHLLNGSAPLAEQRLRHLPASQIATTAITVAELRFGALHSARSRDNLERAETFLAALRRLPFEDSAAAEFARIKQQLVSRGRPIGALDLCIAAIACAADGTLVTGNLREFRRVPGLSSESWLSTR